MKRVGGNGAAVLEHHVVEQEAGVGLFDADRLLHRLGGEADLVADELSPRASLIVSHAS